MKLFTYLVLLLMFCLTPLFTEQSPTSERAYILGPEDAISVHVVDLPELDSKSVGVIHVDRQGNIHLPLAGRVRVSGLTVEQLEKEVASRLKAVMNDPEVSVSVVEFRSHPVSVLGAVRSPGVYQVTGRKTLFEVLSLVGGLNQDAGNTVKVTRQVSAGRLPLRTAVSDPTGEFNIGQLNLRNVMDAKSPEENIDVLANDVITVPKADLVYVVGAVHRAGGFPLAEKSRFRFSRPSHSPKAWIA